MIHDLSWPVFERAARIGPLAVAWVSFRGGVLLRSSTANDDYRSQILADDPDALAAWNASPIKVGSRECLSIGDADVLSRIWNGSPLVPRLYGRDKGSDLYVCGRGDAAGVGDGVVFAADRADAGTTPVEFSFRDWVDLAGGSFHCARAGAGDTVDYEIIAPATPVVPNGGGTGNAIVVSGVIVPAAGNGTHDVNLALAVPLPSSDRTGYWEWTQPDTGKGTISAGVPGAAGWLLLDAAYTYRPVRSVPIVQGQSFAFPLSQADARRLPPQWLHRVTITTTSPTGARVVWHLWTARRATA